MKRFLPIMLALYLGLHNGFLALRDSDADTPVQVFPYQAELYPEADREALARGIPISSREVLTQLLEDYFS